MKTKSAATADARWEAIRARDKSADGTFFFSVKTTGVYCRPSCAARAAKPENVAFHATAADAERAGFRPCKRCKPEQAPLPERQATVIAELCRVIDESEEPPKLEALAHHAGLSPYHVHRMFKAVTGVTPRAYAAARRARRLEGALEKGQPITAAIYEAGFGSSGRFYEASTGLLGMTPRKYRGGGTGLRIRHSVARCSLGAILVAATDKGVCSILLGDDPDALRADLARRFPKAELVSADRGFEALVKKVIALVEAPRTAVALPLDIQGTAFQRRVWIALQKIPAGATSTYSALAQAIGAPKSARAVATACAANAIAVAIPCHRVVRSTGELSGYRWGVERKRALLLREQPNHHWAAGNPGAGRAKR